MQKKLDKKLILQIVSAGLSLAGTVVGLVLTATSEQEMETRIYNDVMKKVDKIMKETGGKEVI